MAGPLDSKHLADLHALAAKLGVERYRMLPRDELEAAILERDPDAGSSEDAVGEPGAEDEATDGARPESAAAERRSQTRRGRSGGRGRGGRPRRERDGGADTDAEEEETGPSEPVSGVLDITPRGHGFIRVSGLEEEGDDDVYVSPSQIRRCEMRRGDEVAGPARPPRRGERFPALVHVDKINGVEPGEGRIRLADAAPVHPSRRIELDPGVGATPEEVVLLRSIDLLWPLAHGQRVRVEAAAGAGRTTLMRALARALGAREDLELVVLLIDERPEEAEAWKQAAPDAELAIATGEMRSGEQLRLVELALGRATRRVEAGTDVVLLVDSLSRIAAAAEDPSRVKPIFGAGRETADEGLGALTVVATTLMGGADENRAALALDSTESSLIVLDRDLAAAGVYPAIDVSASRISGEDQLREPDDVAAARALRVELAAMPVAEAAASLRERIEGSPDNGALLASLTV